jgi:ferritin-like metal-binding protein YciE
MAGYLTACDQASLLDLPEIESLLRETLMEEEAADKKLAGAMRNHIDSSMAEEE